MAKRAVCVGINEFANLPRADWLYGCVNDAQDMSAMLRKRGFPTKAITVLTDSAATKAAIMAALDAMVAGAQAGDQLVFSLSSHGTQVPDTSGDEVDRADECFVCYDIRQEGGQWSPDTVILDDELRDLFARVPKGVVLEVFLDTCHSGTGLKSEDLLSGRRPRFLPPPTVRGLRAVAGAAASRTVTDAVKGLPAANRPILYAGCRSDQTSADATFEGRSNGAFTYYLLQALAQDATRPRSEIHQALTASLRAAEFSQRPTLEAAPKAKKTPVGEPW